ncbi:MAG: hypothetical protein ACFFDH_15040 [Promethearchaeota archaeon]
MILNIFVISPGGVLCYSKNFFEDIAIKQEIFGGFLTAISDFAKEIKGGEVKTLNFGNLNLFYSYSRDYDFIFVIIADLDDLESEIRIKVELMKSEFLRRYGSYLQNWYGNTSIFEDFDEFIIKNIIIPPKILLIGEKGVGKTTIMDLFPGEIILDIDDNLNEIQQKFIKFSDLKDIKQYIIKKIDMNELAYNTIRYKDLLKSIDIILIITNSADSNLRRTKNLYSRLKPKVGKADFYIIANYQDVQDIAIEPEKIEKIFNLKTYGFSAVKEDSNKEIQFIINEILRTSFKNKIDILQI